MRESYREREREREREIERDRERDRILAEGDILSSDTIIWASGYVRRYKKK